MNINCTIHVLLMICKVKYLKNYNLEEWGILKSAINTDSCVDLRAAIPKPIMLYSIQDFVEYKIQSVVYPHSAHDIPYYIITIPSGISIELPMDYDVTVRSRSGLSSKYGIQVINAPGTIDNGYRGEIGIPLINLGMDSFTINPGDRLAQMKLQKVHNVEYVTVEKLNNSERSIGGFGHTGIR